VQADMTIESERKVSHLTNEEASITVYSNMTYTTIRNNIISIFSPALFNLIIAAVNQFSKSPLSVGIAARTDFVTRVNQVNTTQLSIHARAKTCTRRINTTNLSITARAISIARRISTTNYSLIARALKNARLVSTTNLSKSGGTITDIAC